MTTLQLIIAALALFVLLLLLVRRRHGRRLFVGTIWTAPAELFVVLIVVGLAVAGLAGDAIPVGAVLVALALGVLVLGRDVLRDYVLGVSLRTGERLRVGDAVAIDGHEGTVAHVGRLGVSLDDARGRLLVPHAVVARAVVHRRSDAARAVPHRFEFTWSSEVTHPELASRARRAALLSPWAAAGREVESEPLGPRRTAITVYAAAGPHGFEVERAVRNALEPHVRALSLPAPPSVKADGD